jgi:hypothetical protein
MQKTKTLVNHEERAWQHLSRLGGIGAIAQFCVTLVLIAVVFSFGQRPTTADEYFLMYQDNRLIAYLRDEFLSVILIALYLISFSGIYAAMRRTHPAQVFVTSVLTFVAVTLCLTSHSGLSQAHLSDLYAAATTEDQRTQLLAAGQALIASDMWNSTAGMFAGLLMQGAGVYISIIMLGHKGFTKITAWSGILANGLDLVQHLFSSVMPEISALILMIAGVFYLIWYPTLGRDLYRYGSNEISLVISSKEQIP